MVRMFPQSMVNRALEARVTRISVFDAPSTEANAGLQPLACPGNEIAGPRSGSAGMALLRVRG